MLDQVLGALRTLRAPIQQGEYDLHQLVMDALAAYGVPCEHERKLAPRCRIDVFCGGVGVEIKRGKPEPARIRQQLARYAACEQVQALILVTERTVPVPHTLGGKPVRVICLNRLWGIAL